MAGCLPSWLRRSASARSRRSVCRRSLKPRTSRPKTASLLTRLSLASPRTDLAIERLNAKLQSFDYSFAKATTSKEKALLASERLALDRRFGLEVSAMGLETEAVREIAKAEHGGSNPIG